MSIVTKTVLAATAAAADSWAPAVHAVGLIPADQAVKNVVLVHGALPMVRAGAASMTI
ncbi:hypothetical protein [Roseitranquillus sediminis]|uniref:hypothetical protein n=1 Tax=Roseitranquillus sediminis TaxID=2809051 RepID=UPI001D0C6693|nr:hypothetical protein [Roseitranquillus sediminis]MBM9594511.1 hypothetical protein [Roseitranquillus sediminis]